MHETQQASQRYEENEEHESLRPVHFHSLQDFELEIVEACSLPRPLEISSDDIAHVNCEFSDLSSCSAAMRGIVQAFTLLRDHGHCSDHFVILVADPQRANACQTALISGRELEEFSVLLDKAESLYPSRANRFRFRACLDNILADMQRIIRSLHLALDVEDPQISTPISPQQNVQKVVRLYNGLHAILSFGLISFSGTHTANFDCTVFQRNVNALILHQTVILSKKRIRSLDHWTDRPVWIFQRAED
ncbi:hypothetical protein M501DRAFT_1018483 [Patellaria atrata CBS 101060]|uniref:Uncharacterized protein n=1 Tax=Patellaria atrata CBS 101060 TaxID=1346257 RepID=A0A9P4S6Y1_9PEZI|nr:hypothetical protein M501DRAFT_1018483 [Patellaria atrata CBS 101060]